MSDVEIWTDGACSGNPGKGGWAALIRRNKKKEILITGKEDYTTNNRMELLGVISALEMLEENEEGILYSDSQYVINGINSWIKGWKRNNWVTSSKGRVINRDLWEKLDELKSTRRITFKWIRGHSNEEINLVDEYAKLQTH
jgi:ribonuclease HI